jgi:hypothetical protein
LQEERYAIENNNAIRKSLFIYGTNSVLVAANGYGLLLCWYFIMSSLEPQPIEKLMMKITTNAHLYSSDQTTADSEQNDENMFVCQHSSKPNVELNLR